MWHTKTWTKRANMETWLNNNRHKIQYYEIFVNNRFAIEYRFLRVIG